MTTLLKEKLLNIGRAYNCSYSQTSIELYTKKPFLKCQNLSYNRDNKEGTLTIAVALISLKRLKKAFLKPFSGGSDSLFFG